MRWRDGHCGIEHTTLDSRSLIGSTLVTDPKCIYNKVKSDATSPRKVMVGQSSSMISTWARWLRCLQIMRVQSHLYLAHGGRTERTRARERKAKNNKWKWNLINRKWGNPLKRQTSHQLRNSECHSRRRRLPDHLQFSCLHSSAAFWLCFCCNFINNSHNTKQLKWRPFTNSELMW